MSIKIWNGSDFKTEPNWNLIQALFDRILSEEKRKTAVKLVDYTSGQQFSYYEIIQLSKILAYNLKSKGLKNGDTVTLITRNNWQYAVIILACLFSGIRINLLNFDYTTVELELFLTRCKPKIIFCNSTIYQRFASIYNNCEVYTFDRSLPLQCFDDLCSPQSEGIRFTPCESIKNDDVAYIFASSGTSGTPKAVMITYENIFHSCLNDSGCQGFCFDDETITLAYLPMCHIFGIQVLLESLCKNSKIVILDKFSPRPFFEIIEQHKVTHLAAVPSVISFLCKTACENDVTSLKDIVVGGAILSENLQEKASKILNLPIRQMYGMTEAGNCITSMPKNAAFKIGSVGKVTPGHQVKIVDAANEQKLGVNCIGEIRFKGVQVMKGYLDEEELTRNALDEEDFLKTGDLGYFDKDGYLYIVDRIKDIIKYKALQVAPSELENHLLTHPDIKCVSVVGIPDEVAGEIPVAFVVLEEQSLLEEREICEYVANHFSCHKHLRGVRFLKALPRGPTGKILKHELKVLF